MKKKAKVTADEENQREIQQMILEYQDIDALDNLSDADL